MHPPRVLSRSDFVFWTLRRHRPLIGGFGPGTRSMVGNAVPISGRASAAQAIRPRKWAAFFCGATADNVVPIPLGARSERA